MKVAALVYRRTAGCMLMRRRVHKAHDMHADKSDDLRGKLEADESPEQRARREVVEESVRAIDTSSQTAAPYRYSAHEDSYCWVCGGPVTKRHCKITCSRCGFMRDCSDP